MEPSKESWGQSLGWLALRLGIGGFMVCHGMGKMWMLFSGKSEMFGTVLGLPPMVGLSLCAFAEFICAASIMVGLATRFAAAVLVFNMGVAAFVAHADAPWTSEGGYMLWMNDHSVFPAAREPALLFLIPFLALLFAGAGRISLDHILWSRWRARQAADAALSR